MKPGGADARWERGKVWQRAMAFGLAMRYVTRPSEAPTLYDAIVDGVMRPWGGR